MENIEHTLYRIHGSPYMWRKKAEELNYVVELILPVSNKQMDEIAEIVEADNLDQIHSLKPQLFEFTLAMMGFSIECLFKAKIIKDNPSFISNGKMSKKLKSHDLINLAEIAGIKLKSTHRYFCEHSTKAMQDYRYPIQLEYEKPPGGIQGGGDIRESYKELYQQIYPQVSQLGIHDMDKI